MGVGTTYNIADFSFIRTVYILTSRPNIGQNAEQLAARFLEKQALSVLERNYRCRSGEIDLICRDGKTLVFVEVRLRRNAAFGGAGASITFSKQRKIIQAARHYLSTRRNAEAVCRFDCVVLSSLDEHAIEWIRDAFSAD